MEPMKEIKLIHFLVISILAIASTATPAFADVPAASPFPDKAGTPSPLTAIAPPAPPTIAAKSYLLIDYASDLPIAAQDITQRVEPASLTKMMTVYVIDEALKEKKISLNDKIKVSEHAWRATGSRMFLELNSEVSLEEILRGIIIQSGNDASIAVAEHIAGSEPQFAEIMNYFAKKLGLHDTHFVNATGLPDPNHYTTAKDMAILAKALIRDFPETYNLYSQKEFTYKNIKQINRNRLLWRNNLVDGIKTGHTESAGFCLVASGQKNNMRLISVIMGAKSDGVRTEEANKLLEYGFRFFETHKLFPGKIAVKQAPLWFGKEKELGVGFKEDLYVTIPQGQYNNLKATIDLIDRIEAPVEQGKAIGRVRIELGDNMIAEHPVVALNTVEKANIFSRIWDYLVLALRYLLQKIGF